MPQIVLRVPSPKADGNLPDPFLSLQSLPEPPVNPGNDNRVKGLKRRGGMQGAGGIKKIVVTFIQQRQNQAFRLFLIQAPDIPLLPEQPP